MTNMEITKVQKLIDRYNELNGLILHYTSSFHDEIAYDIDGYSEELYEEDGLTADYIENLKARVKACEMLYKALVMFNDETKTIFG